MKFSKLSCAVLSIIALSACGGGGGSSGSHNNQVEPQPEPQPQPQPIEEAGVVVQDFQFNAFSTFDVADIITGGNFDINSKTTVCLDTNGDNSCNGENYSVSGTGLTFTNKLEWPADLDVSGINIIADNNNFIYSISADSGLNGRIVQQSPVSVSRTKIYINPVTSISNFKQFSLEDLFVGYTGNKYSKNDFSAQKPFAQIDQDVLTLGDTLVAVMQHARVNNLSNDEIKNKVSGALPSIINAFQNSGTSVSQVVLNVLQYKDYKHLVKESPSDEISDPSDDPVVPVNTAPFAEFVFEIGADGTVSFINNSRDPDGDNLIYKWNFGDGSESDEQSPVHKYESSGSYNVTLVVTDPSNVSSYATREINIEVVSYKPEGWYTVGSVWDRQLLWGREGFCFIPYSDEKYFLIFNSGESATSSVRRSEKTTQTKSIYISSKVPTVDDIPMTPISETECKGLYYAEIGSVADNYIPNSLIKYESAIQTIYNNGRPQIRTEYKDTSHYSHPAPRTDLSLGLFWDFSLDYPCFVPNIEDYERRIVYESSARDLYTVEIPVGERFMPLSFCGVDGILGKELVYVTTVKVYGSFPYLWPDDASSDSRRVPHSFFPLLYPSSSWEYSSLKYYGRNIDYRKYVFVAPNIINIFGDKLELALVIADGVNFTGNDAVGKFYIGDDPSTAVDFKNGQQITVGESIEVPDDKDYVETKLTLIYNTATTEYILRKYKSDCFILTDATCESF